MVLYKYLQHIESVLPLHDGPLSTEVHVLASSRERGGREEGEHEREQGEGGTMGRDKGREEGRAREGGGKDGDGE